MNVLTNANNPNALKLVAAALIAKKCVNIKIVTTNHNQLSRLPVLELSSGEELCSTAAAALFLAPIEDKYSIIANRWLEWDITQLQPAVVAYGGSGTVNTSQEKKILSLLNELNIALKETKYLIKNKDDITIVDTSIWFTLWSTIVATEIGPVILQEFAHLTRWLNEIENMKLIQDSLKTFNVQRGLCAIESISAGSWFPGISSICQKPSRPITNESSISREKDVELVNVEEIESVLKNWTSESYPSLAESSYPILPKKGERNILITSALPYVNNVPHLGNIIGCVLSADIFARYCRQKKYNTLYISGTDEYGTATEAKALEEKTTPQKICDKFFSIHNDVYRWFGIGFDYFGRTTTPEQTEIVQDLFLRIKEQGYISSNSVDQLLCENCDKFLADRFVEGTCPGCKYEDARGDQCDGCGHLVNATELINPRCKICSSKPTVKASTHLFLDLPSLETKLKEWASEAENGWSSVARVVTKPWLRDGLKSRCITRDLKWGIPVPMDGYRNKVFYVWFDAPIGYISITKKYTKEYEKWWKPENTDVSLYQFMAKDNVPFHAVMFPATILAANQGHTMVKSIMATEYLNYEDTKFSKSRGVGVFGTDAKETGILPDVWRFYLAYIRPETQDSNFKWEDLAMKNNSELLNNLGNFVNRALMFLEKNFESKIPPMDLQEDDLTVLALVQRELTSYNSHLEQAKLRDGLRHVLMISKHGNQYMQSQQPWVKIKGTADDKSKAGTIIGVCCNLSCLISALLAPFMPNTARELRNQLGLDKTTYGYIPNVISIILPAGHIIGKPSPLFTKIEDQKIEQLKKKYSGSQSTTPPEPVLVPEHKDVATLTEAIAKQGQLVRELKAKESKSVWQPHVKILLDLKKELADLQSTESSKVPSPAQNSLINGTAEVAELEEAIAKQGLIVRDLKAKESKTVWQPQVEILLSLKQKLSTITGASTVTTSDKKSKKKK